MAMYRLYKLRKWLLQIAQRSSRAIHTNGFIISVKIHVIKMQILITYHSNEMEFAFFQDFCFS